MTASRARLIRERLAAIVTAEIPAIITVLTGDESEITLDMLPAVRILPGRVLSRQANGAFGQIVQRNFRFLLYVGVVNMVRAEEEEEVNVQAAEDWLDVLPLFWRTRVQLRLLLDDDPIDVGVSQVGLMTGNDQPAWLKYQKQGYTGVVNDLPITYVL